MRKRLNEGCFDPMWPSTGATLDIAFTYGIMDISPAREPLQGYPLIAYEIMKQRKPVPKEKVRPQLSEEDKRAIVKQRQAVELAAYQVEHRKRMQHVRNPRTPGRRTKQEKRLEARQLDYERSGLSTKQPGAYHRPGSLQ